MSYDTYTTTDSATFTVTHARHIAIKIGTDLKRLQRFYGKPSNEDIGEYENEVIALLQGDYIDRIAYGFKNTNEVWCVALKYEARSGGILITDDDPGRIRPGIDITGCQFNSFLVTNQRWDDLSEYHQEHVYEEARISFRRKAGNEPYGNWKIDRVYSAGGRGVQRSSVY